MKKLFSVRTIILAGSLLLQLGTLSFQTHAAAGDVDLSFDAGSGVNGIVNAVAVQSDGKVLIGGEFTSVKGLTRFKIARLNADGSGDSSFNPALLDYELSYPVLRVLSVAAQSDGKVLVGHNYGVTRLNSDGSPDTNFVASLGFLTDDEGYQYADVRTIALQSDGKVLVGGSFLAPHGIARLNADGSPDGGFNPSAATVFGTHGIALQPDGKMLVAGGTSTDGTNYTYGLVRLNTDGSLDGSFNPGAGAPGAYVAAIALEPDGKVLVAGTLNTGYGTNRVGAVRLNANGSRDNSFNPGRSLPGFVNAIAWQADGKVLVGGAWNAVNGTNQNGLARFNVDGTLDTSFNPNLGPEWDDYAEVKAIVAQPNGKVLLGGYLAVVNGTNRKGIARLNANGSLDSSFDPGKGVNDLVVSVVAQPNGKLFIGGDFTTLKDLDRSGTARLDPDGSGDSTFSAASTLFAYGGAYPMAMQPDGKLLRALITTRLNTNGSVDTNFHADLTGTFTGDCWPGYLCSDSPFGTAVTVQPDGKLLIGGVSSHYNCDPIDGGCIVSETYFVTRLNADGSRDTNFNSITNVGGVVTSIAMQPDGKVLIGGYFSSGLARLNANGSLDGSFNASARVDSLVLQPDGKILIGGYFISVNGTNRNRIARLNADGSLDSTFDPGAGANARVYSIALQPDGRILIGGYFTNFNGTSRNRIARLNGNGSLDSSFNPGTAADGGIRSIALQSDGHVLIAGDFLTVNGVVRPHVARLYGDSFPPSLTIARSNVSLILSWPVTALNFQLQENTNLALPNSWSSVAQLAVTNGAQISVMVPSGAEGKFFRLKSQ